MIKIRLGDMPIHSHSHYEGDKAAARSEGISMVIMIKSMMVLIYILLIGMYSKYSLE